MNYINELNAFYDWTLINNPSTGQIALWYALMQINNKCCWKEWFSVSNSILENSTGLSRSGILKARNSLKQAGLIDFNSKGTKSTSYKLFSISKSKQESVQDSMQASNQESVQSSNTINKQEQIKQKDSKKKNNKKEKELSPFEQALVDFTDHRKALKKPLTEHGLKLIVSKLEKLEPVSVENRIKILEQSMVNGWTGIFPLKKEVSNYGYTGENETNQGNEQEYGYIGQTY